MVLEGWEETSEVVQRLIEKVRRRGLDRVHEHFRRWGDSGGVLEKGTSNCGAVKARGVAPVGSHMVAVLLGQQ